MAAGGVGVIVTAVRLGAYNGLHLVIRKNALNPHIRCIVIGLPATGPATSTALASRSL